MSTSTQVPSSNGLVQIQSLEEMIRERVTQERERLEKEAGIVHKEVHHFHKPIERPFTADQRHNTTLLFGGLTWKHEKLVHGALEGLGYKCEVRADAGREGIPARQGIRQQRPVQPDVFHRRQPGAVSAEARKKPG